MMRFLVFLCALTFVACIPARESVLQIVLLSNQTNASSSPGQNTWITVYFDKENSVDTDRARDKGNICSDSEADLWIKDFHRCLSERNFNDGVKDQNSIIDRILDQSSDCVRNSTKLCRPNPSGFLAQIHQILYEIKDYYFRYLKDMKPEKQNVKDFECIEKSISQKTYKYCFKDILDHKDNTEAFQRRIEKAISCSNKSQKYCSKSSKTSLNTIVWYILGVKQPDKENIEDDTKPTTLKQLDKENTENDFKPTTLKQPEKENTEDDPKTTTLKQPEKENTEDDPKTTTLKQPDKPKPPKRWYEHVVDFFVNVWKGIKNFFGF